MKTTTRSDILQIIQKKKNIRPSAIRREMSISAVALHKHLAQLLKTEKITKTGTAPHVSYMAIPPHSPLTRSTILKNIASNQAHLRQFGITKIGVFGSYARGDQQKNSDIDLLVEFHPTQETFRNVIRTTKYIESLFTQPVDLVTPNGLSPYIKPYIDHDISYVQISH